MVWQHAKLVVKLVKIVCYMDHRIYANWCSNHLTQNLRFSYITGRSSKSIVEWLWAHRVGLFIRNSSRWMTHCSHGLSSTFISFVIVNWILITKWRKKMSIYSQVHGPSSNEWSSVTWDWLRKVRGHNQRKRMCCLCVHWREWESVLPFAGR